MKKEGFWERLMKMRWIAFIPVSRVSYEIYQHVQSIKVFIPYYACCEKAAEYNDQAIIKVINNK
jgi:hypothetical protein